MASIAEQLLAVGCIPALGITHGETVTVLSGPDSGVSFAGVVNELEPDAILSTEEGEDPRCKRFLRFQKPGPRIYKTGTVRTEDGRRWQAMRKPGNAFITIDFEINEIAANDK